MSKTILFGNEKGGSGKTTSAVHLIVGLLKLGFSVASVDLDSYQQSLTRYLENRQRTAARSGITLMMPEHFKMSDAERDHSAESTNFLEKRFTSLLEDLERYDFIVIDTPGSHSEISKLAHSYADTIITPVNDSFLDIDLVGHIRLDDFDMITPGVYSAMLFEQKLRRASRDKEEIDWIVVRNRLSTLDALNKRNIELALRKLSKKLGFRIAPGFGDRVIFKELFLAGLTLYDSTISGSNIKISASVLAARQEMREFMRALQIPEINALIPSPVQ